MYIKNFIYTDEELLHMSPKDLVDIYQALFAEYVKSQATLVAIQQSIKQLRENTVDTKEEPEETPGEEETKEDETSVEPITFEDVEENT